jgi:hypothetical protein
VAWPWRAASSAALGSGPGPNHFKLLAAAGAQPSDYLVTVRATSGGVVHDAAHLIRVMAQLPPPLQTPTFNSASIRGGTSSTGTVALAGPAPAGGGVISLLNGNPSVATVPATVTIPEGQTSAAFTVTTTSVAATTYVSINANYQTVIYPSARAPSPSRRSSN